MSKSWESLGTEEAVQAATKAVIGGGYECVVAVPFWFEEAVSLTVSRLFKPHEKKSVAILSRDKHNGLTLWSCPEDFSSPGLYKSNIDSSDIHIKGSRGPLLYFDVAGRGARVPVRFEGELREVLIELKLAKDNIKHPWARREVMLALAALGDPAYQEKYWVKPFTMQCESLDLAIHVLYDDYCVLPDPDWGVGNTLVEGGSELDRLRELDEVFGPLIDRLGDNEGPTYMADPEWPQVMRLAGIALCAMVQEGPMHIPDEDDDSS